MILYFDSPLKVPMKSLVFIILSNPIISHKPAEAMRIASGMLALGHPVYTIFSQNALNFFINPVYKFIDSDIAKQSLLFLNKSKATLRFLTTSNSQLLLVNDHITSEYFEKYSELKFEPIEWKELCQIIENSNAIFLF